MSRFYGQKKEKIHRSTRIVSAACYRDLWKFTQIETWPYPTPEGVTWLQVGIKKSQFYIFRQSYKLTLDDLWPLWPFDLMNMCRYLLYINWPSLVTIGFQLFKWCEYYILAHLTTWPLMTFDLSTWPLTLVHDLWLHEHIKGPILYPQTRFGSNLTFQIRSFSHF